MYTCEIKTGRFGPVFFLTYWLIIDVFRPVHIFCWRIPPIQMSKYSCCTFDRLEMPKATIRSTFRQIVDRVQIQATKLQAFVTWAEQLRTPLWMLQDILETLSRIVFTNKSNTHTIRLRPFKVPVNIGCLIVAGNKSVLIKTFMLSRKMATDEITKTHHFIT